MKEVDIVEMVRRLRFIDKAFAALLSEDKRDRMKVESKYHMIKLGQSDDDESSNEHSVADHVPPRLPKG